LILVAAFLALALMRLGATYRRQIMARWPAFVFAAAAILAIWRGAVEPALALAALAAAAWLASPMLLARKPQAGLERPADAEARAILGVGLAASPDDIRNAYRRKMADAHPDRGGSHDAAARLTAARDALLKRTRQA
jgi:DnaJ-domain-containing protein 1